MGSIPATRNTYKMDFNSVEYLQRLQLFFLKKGKKSLLETQLRRWMLNRALQEKSSLNSLLQQCILHGTPFVNLKTRRRGKRVFYKVGYMDRYNGERKSLGVLRNTLKGQIHVSFIQALEKEIETLAAGKSPIVEKRDEMHRLALEAAPSGWLNVGRRRRRSESVSDTRG